MSCCGGNCKCGDSCNCGGGCKMFPDIAEQTKTVTHVAGFAPVGRVYEMYEMSTEGGNNDCKCGSNCSCDNCTCK